MIDKISNDARVYTDVQGLEQLRSKLKKDPVSVKKEVARQFESLLMQMVLRSMRDANKAFTSDLYGNEQMEFYQDIFDKQIALVVSNSNNSLATMIEKNIDQQQGVSTVIAPTAPIISSQPPMTTSSAKQPIENTTKKIKEVFSTKEEFIKSIWSAAKQAAIAIGINPHLLIAQAALETNWGKKIVPFNEHTSSYNLFNIKADADWPKKTAPVETLEQENGVLVKEKSAFRSYNSFMESFMDYIGFLKKNDRYNEALHKTADSHEFVHALQKAGYATDTHYADKVLSIFSSHSFKRLMATIE
jgi:flagellar protein FlgJ